MRRLVLLNFLVVFALALAGCGGQLGHNSPTQVRLESVAGTTDFSNLHVIISPNNGSAVSVDAASDIQAQLWATFSSGLGFKELDFTTTSQQIPYFVYIQNSAATSQDVRLRIIMDGNEKFNQTVTVAGSTTVQEKIIFRNNVG